MDKNRNEIRFIKMIFWGILSAITIGLIYYYIGILNQCDCIACGHECIAYFEILLVVLTVAGIFLGSLMANIFEMHGGLKFHLILQIITGLLYVNLFAYLLTMTPAEAMPWFKVFMDLVWAILILTVLFKKIQNKPILLEDKLNPYMMLHKVRVEYIIKTIFIGILTIIAIGLFVSYFVPHSENNIPTNTMIVLVLYSLMGIMIGWFVGRLFFCNHRETLNLIMILLIVIMYLLIFAT